MNDTAMTQPAKVAGALRRAVRPQEFIKIPGERHMECAYYFDFCRLRLKWTHMTRSRFEAIQ